MLIIVIIIVMVVPDSLIKSWYESANLTKFSLLLSRKITGSQKLVDLTYQFVISSFTESFLS